MATAALVLAVPPEVVPPHAATTSTVATANDWARALRVIRLPPCLRSTRWESNCSWDWVGITNAIGNRMLGQPLDSGLWPPTPLVRPCEDVGRTGSVDVYQSPISERLGPCRPGCRSRNTPSARPRKDEW